MNSGSDDLGQDPLEDDMFQFGVQYLSDYLL